MKRALLTACLLLGLLCSATGQPNAPQEERFTISGYLKDATSGEELLYASIFEPTTKSGTTTNLYGFYSLTLPPGTYELTFSYIGFQPLVKTVALRSDVELNVEMQPAAAVLEEVVVTDKKEDQSVQQVAMSRLDVPIEEIKKLPSLLGEPDVIKTIQTLPGVTSAGEGTSAFFVRGGSADQNLILIDEAPVYDVSHLFGLFSVFNADIIKSAELYKGGIPAKYGGRLSSLLEVTTRDGNAKQFSATGGVGLLAAKLTLEGPIVEDKASFIVSGRRSYADLYMKNSSQFDGTAVSFYDLNAKANWKANNKNRFFLAVYGGRDIWQFDNNFKMDWGNQTATFRWNHLFNDRLFSNLTLVYSDFDYVLHDKDPVDGFLWEANQREASFKEDITYFITPDFTLKFGYQGIYRRFTPGTITSNGAESIFKSTSLQQQFALDHALYLGAEHQVTERLSLEYGLRYSLFQNIGKGTIYEYEDPADNVDIIIRDSTTYQNFETIKLFHNPEPRFAARYMLDQQSSFKASYNRMVQYVHLISNSTVPVPFATWAPSSPYLGPQKADQVAVGYFRNFRDNMFEFSAEAYYKKADGLTEFADNAELFFNPHLATEFRQGRSESYGLEFYLRKSKGNLTGFASYTLSEATMEVAGVNNDKAFPANHDRRHNLNLAMAYSLSPRWSLGANFTYASGRPITLPAGKYDFDGYLVNFYSSRNGYRLPAFHRLDLSATYEPKKNENRRWQNSFVVGVYNAYNRQNPWTIYTRTKQDDDGNIIGDGTEKEARMVYLFGALPYFSWNFKF
ncbi:MAG: TonB-dependent receptor [Phaeodactylibacter sp.]|nr:TonB-dependent receptor [Phaeodactylibacter sp.]MCB9266935.1 TonB-dependent receptor [Lewinellaceae bacterium]MCB9285719.1 TonB-dependent receptor [Lewinellaceae bacterium]